MTSSHQLAAILFADIQGYTALMEDDESRAHSLREKLKKILEHDVPYYNGRILKLSGDGALCIFNSAIEAVRAAIDIQKKMSHDPKVPLRIGIHMGDVVFEEGDIFGDGVNVASRIESFAIPGSVFISGKVLDEIKNKKDIATIPLGKFELKNVSVPVEIFAVSNEGLIIPEKKTKLDGKGKQNNQKNNTPRRILIVTLSLVLLALILYFRQSIFKSVPAEGNLEKSIAVLPFANLSSDKNDEYFADGMCDEILTHISKIAALKVISRTSVLQYKNTTKNLRQIAEELGVNTVLEGTVQKVNDRVRINVQLINAETDEHLWAQDYDRSLADVFAIQSEVAEEIAHQLKVAFTDKEKIQVVKIPTNNLDAYSLYIRANALYDISGNDTAGILSSLQMMQQVVKLDSNFTLAWCKLLQMHTDQYWYNPDANLFRSELAKKALDNAVRIDPDLPEVHLAKGIYFYHGERKYDEALREFDIALNNIPNNSTLLEFKALVLRRIGKWKEAVACMDQAFELSPIGIFITLDRANLEFEVCNYNEVNKMLDHAKSAGLNSSDYINNKTSLVLVTGTVEEARKIFDDGMKNSIENAFTKNYLYQLNSFEGKYSEAINAMNPDSEFLIAGNGFYGPNTMFIGLQYFYNHDSKNANIYFGKARAMLEKINKNNPDDPRVYGALAITYAGLKLNEQAIIKGKKAIELLPIEKDQVDGLKLHQALAMCYSLLDRKDDAIAELQLIQKYPGLYGTDSAFMIFKSDPIWNNLRSDPRFVKLWEGNGLKPLFKI